MQSRSVMLPAVPCSISTAAEFPDLGAPGELVCDWAAERVDFGSACWQFESSLVVEWNVETGAELLNSKRHLKAKEKAASQAE